GSCGYRITDHSIWGTHFALFRSTRATPCRPHGNGLVERTNRTIKALLQSLLERHQADGWHEILPGCMLAYQTSVRTTARYTSPWLRLGHELRSSVEL
ncbi:uncharacterized protein DEA37_0013246, partial [Paragonimus westermani]